MKATLCGEPASDSTQHPPDPPTLDTRILHKCHHISKQLGKEAWFCEYYLEQRREQMKSDLQTGGGKRAFIEHYQTYFLRLAGFFAVEDFVLRTAPDLLPTTKVWLCYLIVKWIGRI